MKIVAMIQARMGSTRFPGKVLARLNGEPVLQHVISHAQLLGADSVMVLTTDLKEDRKIISFCEKLGVEAIPAGKPLECFHWYHRAAINCEADWFVRICGDSPFIDPILNSRLVEIAREYAVLAPYISYRTADGVPAILSTIGIFCEVVKTSELGRYAAYSYGNTCFMVEHVTPHLYQFGSYIDIPDHIPQHRKFKFSIDTKDDLEFCEKYFAEIHNGDYDKIPDRNVQKYQPYANNMR